MQKAELAQPKIDENLVRAQAPAQPTAVPAPPTDVANSSERNRRSSSTRKTVGRRHSRRASAENVNFNQEATLKLIVRNTGTSDALNVDIQDELPEGLEHVSSQPEMTVTAKNHLTFRIETLPAGSVRTITIRVKPTKIGPFDHTATVRFETGCRSRTRVLQPKLKVDVVANPTTGNVLRGQPVEFKVTVSNLGDGVARNVAIQAKLTTGLRHETNGKSDDPILYELTLPELLPGRSEKLETLVADAVVGGEQGCTVSARSPDVIPFIKEEAEVTKTIAVVEPKLKLTLDGPDTRYTDTIADYQILLENSGTAPARKIRLAATLPISGHLVGKIPPDARFDATTRKLSWTIDQLEPNGKSLAFPFHVRMGGIGLIEILAEANGDGGLKAKELKRTEVSGMPDVDLVVSERKRALDVNGTTTFEIRLRNYGTKEATNLQVFATLSENLKVTNAGGGSKDLKVAVNEKNEVKFGQINKLGPGKEMFLGIAVKVIGPEPKLASCRVSVLHDDLTDKFEDMAAVKITNGRRAAAAPAGTNR